MLVASWKPAGSFSVDYVFDWSNIGGTPNYFQLEPTPVERLTHTVRDVNTDTFGESDYDISGRADAYLEPERCADAQVAQRLPRARVRHVPGFRHDPDAVCLCGAQPARSRAGVRGTAAARVGARRPARLHRRRLLLPRGRHRARHGSLCRHLRPAPQGRGREFVEVGLCPGRVLACRGRPLDLHARWALHLGRARSHATAR